MRDVMEDWLWQIEQVMKCAPSDYLARTLKDTQHDAVADGAKVVTLLARATSVKGYIVSRGLFRLERSSHSEWVYVWASTIGGIHVEKFSSSEEVLKCQDPDISMWASL